MDAQNKEFLQTFMPSKIKTAAFIIGALVINVALFIGAVGVIAYAVKWVIS